MEVDLKEATMKRIIKKLLYIEDNILFAENIFLAKKAVEWVLSTTKDPKVINSFMLDLEKHFAGTTRLQWIDEVLTNTGSYSNDQGRKKNKKASRASNAE